MARLREYLILGLLTLAPVTLTLWVLISIITFLDSAIYAIFPAAIEPKNLFGMAIPGLGIVVTFLLLLCTGFLAKTMAGKFFQSISDKFISRVPIVSGLYNVAKQMSTVFFSNESSRAFQKVVLVPFPSPDSRSIAFLTGKADALHSLVYVPTAPNPTSGYVLAFKTEDLQESSMGVDEALKLILSCGAVGNIPSFK